MGGVAAGAVGLVGLVYGFCAAGVTAALLAETVIVVHNNSGFVVTLTFLSCRSSLCSPSLGLSFCRRSAGGAAKDE